jgi:hypothetical protein
VCCNASVRVAEFLPSNATSSANAMYCKIASLYIP